jgi:thiamine-phosphate pyrophosphorylase
MAPERSARAPLRGLYAITPEGLPSAELVRRVRAALEGGACLVQYRAKRLDAASARAEASGLLACCRSFGVPLVVNDSLELALAIDADGLHLGRDDGDVRAARAAMPGAILGVSCYDDPARAAAAARAGADYVAIGSVFASGTKPGAVRAPLERLREARLASGVAVAAIGGINAHNAPLAIAAGADLLAVIDAVFSAPDVRAAARSLADAFLPRPGIPQDRVTP